MIQHRYFLCIQDTILRNQITVAVIPGLHGIENISGPNLLGQIATLTITTFLLVKAKSMAIEVTKSSMKVAQL